MKQKRFITDYLAFSRKERTAVLSLLAIILILYLIPFVHGYYAGPVAFRIDTTLLATLDRLEGREDADTSDQEFSRYGNSTEYAPSYKEKEVFAFDPNQATRDEWLRLGLSEKTALTIDRYRQKGGRFYRKEDLQRIWGLPKGFYERVKDFIVIPPKETPDYTSYEKKEYLPKARTPLVISVNSADSTAFEALPGIGAKLSSRIVGFREKLGGFYSVDQVGETYGLPDSTFQKIRPLLSIDRSVIRTININTATKDELKSHPYIRWNLANAIVAYRIQHGNFLSVEDLKKIAVIDNKTYEKLLPYCRTE